MISSSDSLLKPKAVVALVSISFVTGSLLFGAGYYYMGLGCDGGWYSYPALSLSRGGSPVENLSGLDEIEPVEGVKALFGFKTHTSIRSFYTTLWLKYLPDTIYSLKLLSLLELLLLFGAFYLLISRFCKDPLARLLLLGIFVNDKTILLSAASDFRPDLMVAALSCITLALIADRKRASSLVLAMVLSSLIFFTHVTGVIPFVFIMSYAIVLNILDGRLGLRDNYMYLVIGMASLLIFMNADGILDRLLQSGSHVLAPTVVAGNKISTLWAKGVEFIVSKELTRWKTYFFTSNVTQLLVLLIGVILCFRPSLSFLRKDTMGLAMLISLGIVFTFLAVFDPHRADTHAVSVIPFFFVLLAHAIETRQMYRKQITYVLAALLCIASLSSLALFLKVGLNARTSGYSIAAVSGAFDELVSRSDHTYRIVGPTEIWPFMPAQRNVLIIDKTRSSKEDNMRFIEQIVDSLDYAVVNHDYHANGWEERFLRHFPYYDLETIRTIGSAQGMLKIYRIRRRKEVNSGIYRGEMSDVLRHAAAENGQTK